ncbi:putative ribosomal protein S6 kinase alpha-2 [Folsomia candida]|uniref:non-specific serine/threonine protein kinase n=1 Tax=Folsomia candida TaxID=158441 RepID=A0A226DKT1_FOLCA|nr:putative ribosomal protein S6 kinase alpha-2 [Folsomia candida]OXA46152.1 Interferon-induced, double-stranded RNA-activated protein kinase [Folsomia candida]
MSSLDEVKLESFLGWGSFGLVFCTINKATREKFATKFIYELGPDYRVEREALLLGKPLHRNIVAVKSLTQETFPFRELNKFINSVDIKDEDGQRRRESLLKLAIDFDPLPICVIKMELLGDNLTWISIHSVAGINDPGLQAVKLQIIQDLMNGLKLLHDNKITHRDVKPANALFAYSGRPEQFVFPLKIGDFGLSREILGEATKETLTARQGTKLYRAPEVDTGNCGRQADLYSLGLVIFELVMLFKEKEERNDKFKLVKCQDYSVLDSAQIIQFVSINLRPLIIRMVQPEVVHRLTSIHDVRTFVDQAVGELNLMNASMYNPEKLPKKLVIDTVALMGLLQDPNSQRFLSNVTFKSYLGGGSFGFVYQTHNSVMNKDTAVKVLVHKQSEGDYPIMIARETGIAASLNHKHIVNVTQTHNAKLTASEYEKLMGKIAIPRINKEQIRDTLIRRETISLTFIEMELCGQTLRSWLNTMCNDPSLDLILEMTQFLIVRGIREALAYLHSKNILHRDLKPENVLFTSSEFKLPVKIGDFGLSRIIDFHESTLTSNVGTYMYMAPEVQKGERYGKSSDLYSFGLIMLEVLDLIKLSARSKIFNQIVYDQEFELVKQCHTVIINSKELIISLTRKKPADRLKDISDVKFITDLN